MTKRFKYFHVDGPPVLSAHVLVIHKASGQPLHDVIEAHAVDGWIKRQAFDRMGNPALDDHGKPVIERIETEVAIVAGPTYPKDRLSLNMDDDLISGVVFDDDMTDRDRAFCERSAPASPNFRPPLHRR